MGCADFVLHYILLIHMMPVFRGVDTLLSAHCRATRASWRLRSADWRGKNEREKKNGGLGPTGATCVAYVPIMYRELEKQKTVNGETATLQGGVGLTGTVAAPPVRYFTG